ncbi:MAG: molybdopterin-dependent oxidoreductase, partial [Candidatus Eremiobacteraeota bacterium]|nr:molybdopterin-dependent oxidoreductase [Candidatus Eremiobacteraeota bacterium]
MPNQATVTIDGVQVTVPAGTLLVEAAKQIQKDIPVYCYHTKLGPAGLSRICLVAIEGTPKLQIACNTTVTDGMVVHTQGDDVDEGRRAVLEVLLLNHPLDCPICDKGGECDLQDFSMAYGQSESRLADRKLPKPKAVDLGPTIVLDEERCILCLRCVRFDDIVTFERSLRTEDRGAKAIITTATAQPYVSDFSGNVTELCPVGALTSKTYRFKSRPWDLHRTETSCLQCSVGCRMNLDARHGRVSRVMSVPHDDPVSDGWLCDRGRYNIAFASDPRRITTPRVSQDGEYQQIGWDDALSMWADSVKQTIAAGGAGAVGVIGGGRLLNEEAWLLAHVYRALGVENIDWRAGRQRQASPGAYGGTYADLENAEAIVTLGRPLAQNAPIADLRIRKAVTHRGARLIAVGDYGAGSPLSQTRIASLDRLSNALPANVTRVAFVWDGVEPETAAALDAALSSLAGKTAHVFIPGEQPNARGAQMLGCVPRGDGLDVRGMLEAARDGTLRSLAILGANPLLRFPDRALVESALAKVDFLVVSELFPTLTAECANLIFPVRAPFEKTGTTTNMAGERLRVAAGVAPPDATLSDEEMLIALADVLDVNLPAPESIDQAIASALSAPAASALADDALFGTSPPPRQGDDGLRLLVFDNIFSGGGTVWYDDAIAELRPRGIAVVAAETARALGLEVGDLIDLGPEGDGPGLHDLVVRIDEHATPRTVGVIDGLVEEPANTLGAGT